MNVRRMLGFIREGDPGAWRCHLCSKWTNRDECYNHRVRVFRDPITPRPQAAPQPEA